VVLYQEATVLSDPKSERGPHMMY